MPSITMIIHVEVVSKFVTFSELGRFNPYSVVSKKSGAAPVLSTDFYRSSYDLPFPRKSDLTGIGTKFSV